MTRGRGGSGAEVSGCKSEKTMHVNIQWNCRKEHKSKKKKKKKKKHVD